MAVVAEMSSTSSAVTGRWSTMWFRIWSSPQIEAGKTEWLSIDGMSRKVTAWRRRMGKAVTGRESGDPLERLDLTLGDAVTRPLRLHARETVLLGG